MDTKKKKKHTSSNKRNPDDATTILQLDAMMIRHCCENVFHKYVNFVRRYRPVFRLVEDCFGTLLNYVPSRYCIHDDDDVGVGVELDDEDRASLVIEKWFSALNVWSLVHDAIESYSKGGFEKTWLWESIRIVPILLSSIECFELVLEKSAMRVEGQLPRQESNRRQYLQGLQLRRQKVVFVIEGCKALLRLLLLLEKVYKAEQFDDESSEFDEGNYIIFDNGVFAPCYDDNRSQKKSQKELVKCTYYSGRRTLRRIKCFDALKYHDIYLQRQKVLEYKIKLVAGEVLHISRPFVGACLEFKQNNQQSIRKQLLTWTMCLLIDVLSNKLSTSALGDKAKMSTAATDELKHRKARWMLYLIRAPIWNLVSKPTTRVVERTVGILVPIFGRNFAAYIMSMLLYMQKHHFLLESSI